MKKYEDNLLEKRKKEMAMAQAKKNYRPGDNEIAIRTKLDSIRAYCQKHVIAIILIISIAVIASYNYLNFVSTSTPETSVVSGKTWHIKLSDYANNRWFGDGLAEIYAAKTPEEARDAASVWLERVKTDPVLLSGATKSILKRDVDRTKMFDENDMATLDTVALVAELRTELATARFKVGQAPEDGTNTGVENDTVVSSDGQIGGDRTAIEVTLDDGSTFWVMARCGNIVTRGSSNLPPGKTDNPPIPTPTPDTPLTPKNSSESTVVNPAVDDWKKDDVIEHTVSTEDGASVSNGLQNNPEADAAAAAADAEAAAAENTVAHEAAVEEAVGGVVDDNQSHTISTPPTDW
ncbi:MAG: hypothetical protein PWQ10_50 [Patescibacteria group bacterium]|nr:hypothetical protein [Patescibacteria group bacterium]